MTTASATFDVDSNLVQVEHADASGIVRQRASWAFDPAGLLLSSSAHHLDSAGNTTSTDTTTPTYDAALRVTTITDPLSNATSISYDGVSRISQLIDAATNKLDLVYDDNGNVTTATRSDWNQATAAYDVLVLEHTYDALDRRTSTTRRDGGSTMSSTTSVEYDGRGLPTQLTDALGNTVRQEWDARGALLKTLRDLRAGGTGAGAVTSTITNSYQYDLAGRTLSLTDGLSNGTSYEYDDRGRVKKVTNAAGQSSTYTFDANGNVATATDPNGTVVTNTWDVMDRLTAQSANPATGVIGDTSLSIAYDALGRPVSIVDNDSTVQRTYDSLGRLVSETQGPNPLGGQGKTFSYLYSAAGFNTQVTYPDATVELRNRDVIGRLSSVAIQGGSTLASYQYSGSRVPTLTLPNNVVRTHTYDALQRNTMVDYTQNTTSLKKFEYVFNLADMRLLEKRHHSGGTGDNYALDSLYRTVQVKAGVADPVAEYQNPGSQTVASTTGVVYDAAQNRSQVTVTTGGTPATTNYTPDALNFYTSVGGTTHVRDANGNLTDDGTNLYEYDYRNQLVRIRRRSDQVVIATYEYDGIARRTAKTVSGGTTSFYWIGYELAMEYDAAGLVSRRHRGAGFGAVVSAHQRDFADLDTDGSTTDYVPLTPLYDGAFDCVGVLDLTGAVAESYVHTYEGVVSISDAAGNPLSVSAVGWRQGYGGLYRDSESTLLYSLCRFYAPNVGRFITEDPLGRWVDSPGQGNGYVRIANSYRNSWDPLGLKDERGQPGVSASASMAVGVMYEAAEEAERFDEAATRLAASVAAYSPLLGSALIDLVETPEDVKFFKDEIYAEDVDIDTGAPTPSGRYKKRYGEWKYYKDRHRIVYNFWAMRRDKVFTLAFAHELLHVTYYRCTSDDDHHGPAFFARLLKTERYLRLRSPTLRLFEEWLDYTSKEARALDAIHLSAKMALAGKSPADVDPR